MFIILIRFRHKRSVSKPFNGGSQVYENEAKTLRKRKGLLKTNQGLVQGFVESVKTTLYSTLFSSFFQVVRGRETPL